MEPNFKHAMYLLFPKVTALENQKAILNIFLNIFLRHFFLSAGDQTQDQFLNPELLENHLDTTNGYKS